MRLFHFSEDPAIPRFEPRSPQSRPEVEPLVWAVDEPHTWTYLFPRDCPRVLLWPTERTTLEDRHRWLHSEHGRVACVEWRWLATLRETAVFQYELPPESFVPLDDEDEAWMYISRTGVVPVAVEPVGDLLNALRDANVEVRFMPSLAPLYGAWQTSIHFSGIRLRNATGWPG